MASSNKKTEKKTNSKATITRTITEYFPDECAIKVTIYARTNDEHDIKKVITRDFPKDEFRKLACVRWSNTTLCNFLRMSPELLAERIPYQTNYDVRYQRSEAFVFPDDEQLHTFISIRVWSKSNKEFVNFEALIETPFPSDKQREILSVDNLVGYENV